MNSPQEEKILEELKGTLTVLSDEHALNLLGHLTEEVGSPSDMDLHEIPLIVSRWLQYVSIYQNHDQRKRVLSNKVRITLAPPHEEDEPEFTGNVVPLRAFG